MFFIMDIKTLRVWTGRYADPSIARSGLVAVGVTRYAPRFPLGYRLRANLLLLAPSSSLLAKARAGSLTPKRFNDIYLAQLEAVGIKRVLGILRGLQGRAKGLVLLCYENVHTGERCHRRELASWLERKGGLTVNELNETTTAARVAAIGYVRRSHESDGRTVSLAAQSAAIEEYTRAQGWTLAGMVSDDGVSGGRRERLALLAERVKATGANRVVVFHLDRLARDIVATLDSIRAFAKKGVELHVPGRGLVEVQSATGFLTTGMEGMIAEHYRRLCAERTRSALAHLRAQGKRWTKTPPYGFSWTQDGRVEPDEAEQSAITRARTLRAGGSTLWAISAQLASEGTFSRRGAPLTAKVIRSLLRRPS